MISAVSAVISAVSAVISAVFALSAVSALSAMSAVSRPNSADGDGDGENDRKECFHGTKVSLPPSRVRLSIFAAMCVSNEDRSPPGNHD
jgi:hypothetical protein